MTLNRSDPGSAFTATLPLKTLPRFTGVELLTAANEIMKHTSVVAVLEPGISTSETNPEEDRVRNHQKTPPHFCLTVNGVTISVEGHDRPAFRTAELSRIDFRSWPEGGTQIARSRAHVVIAEVRAFGGSCLDRNFDRAAAVTVLAAAVTKLADTAAIVWHTSRRAIPAEQLPSLLAEMAQRNVPASLWLGCIGWPAGAQGVATRGLFPLLGVEIEVTSQDLLMGGEFNVALEMAVGIFRTGEFPTHGERFPYDGNTKFSIRHRTDGREGTRPTVVLTQSMHPSKPQATARVA